MWWTPSHCCAAPTLSPPPAQEKSPANSPTAQEKSPANLDCLKEEKREEVVEIEDASVEDVRQMVCYMYTGMIEDDYTRFRELLVLAD